ncbi:UDP-N-acetylglucosamine 1-carboxyvinyltransferase [Candidatus Kaiserbacteria bacterium RIFCSPLOWO2_01_FULL_51_21]|uniref:UDP-N-acetylglucosamine 1-carboxyvinyltransferase n=1 Tax=Candidatus Kaiserbacteria bacterium RIFCSPLOWO2_01_FULL_51_21 TaxID=1798508 RepID=A0A1F6EE16_9BACT|nr:MAG: UDP-N-acetylglucosamine 1-carboxyvinyltransferase [Candidatus Kaiserbacteria bacterium RIFCSPLOWO2_01_FULL_51_21]
MKDVFRIEGLEGGQALRGKVRVNGAKNAVLKSMAASILFEDELVLSNVPHIEDVERVAELLSALGAKVGRNKNSYTIDTEGIGKPELDDAIARRLRASIVFSGPLLARFGRVSFPHPGGDVIGAGARPIDLFLEGFQKMGCTVLTEGDRYHIVADDGRLRGAEIFFISVSVTATETLMMAATLAKGTTFLRNAAMEPEIVALAEFLNSCGADIKGAGTPTIMIRGGGTLSSHGKVFETIPDRIETGSFLILGALAGQEVEITDCNPEHVAILTGLLRESGVDIKTTPTTIVVRANGAKFKPLHIRTHEYPGFATDLQPPIVVYLTQAAGESTVFETIFGGRLSYTEDLVRMGADITLWNSRQITIKGPTPLVGKELESPDVRAGLAFVIAATIAKGKSVIDNVYHIDRGYERIEERLRSIGVPIERVGS